MRRKYEDADRHRDGRCDCCGDPVSAPALICPACNTYTYLKFGDLPMWVPKHYLPRGYPNHAQAEYDGDWFGVTDDGSRPRIDRR